MERESAANQRWTALLGGVALGAAAMYLADPVQGKRRRALAQDKLGSFARRTGNTLDLTLRDAGNRWKGVRTQAGRMLRRNDVKPIDDHVLEARVRSKLGRKVSHPHSIQVSADKGRVILNGPILAGEHPALLALVQAIPGVTDVKDRLELHQQSDRIPGLQGEGRRAHAAAGRWMPPRPLTAAAAAIGYVAVMRRIPFGLWLTLAGAGLLAARAAGNRGQTGTGASAAGSISEVEKSVDIKAPPETVFDLWSRYENFPRFMSNVVEVRDLGQQRSHWIVKGPGGVNLEWDAILTEAVRPSVLAWNSEPGAAVEHAGTVRFEAVDGGTRATVRMLYSAPAGALGQGVAKLLGRDPAGEMNQDLQRMKRFIESGMAPSESHEGDQGRGQTLH